MKVHVVTPVWGRPEVTKIFALGIQRIGADITTITSTPEDYKLCEELGLNPVGYSNDYLSNKWNYGIKEALKKEWDELLILGSDDFISNEGFELLKNARQPFRCLDGITLVDAYSGRERMLTSKRKMQYGAGRMIRRSIIEGNVYADGLRSACDRSMMERMRQRGIELHFIKSSKCHVVDLKTKNNMWGMSFFRNMAEPNPNWNWFFSEKEMEMINALKIV